MQRHTGLEIDRDLPTHVDTIVSAQFGKISFDDRISSSLLFSTETERCGILEIMLLVDIQEIIVITLQAHIPLHSFHKKVFRNPLNPLSITFISITSKLVFQNGSLIE